MYRFSRFHYYQKFSLISIITVAFVLYYPGLSGYFVLDDFHILERMRDIGGLRNFQSLKEYVFSGGGGPLKRPVAMLSFAFNASDWPTSAKSFILTNVFIHLATAYLMYFFVRELLTASKCTNSDKVKFVSLVSTAIWLLHPFHISTVLYIVQRMTLLAAFFSICSLLLYLHGRDYFQVSRYVKGGVYWLFSAIFSVIAVLCKESAILIPVFVLLIESILLSGTSNLMAVRAKTFILLPSTLIIAVFLIKIPLVDFFEWFVSGDVPMHGRTFNVFERLLLEGEILWGYLSGIFIPKMNSSGVFYDTGVIDWNTITVGKSLIFWIIHFNLLFLAVHYRSRWPLYSFGVLWFYIGHVLESSVVMLELRFDHRNYLPSFGLVLVVALLVFDGFKDRSVRTWFSFSVMALLGGLLFSASSLWGRPTEAALVWASENPSSSRAHEAVAKRALVFNKDVELAKSYLSKSIALAPYAVKELNYILAFCSTFNGVSPNWVLFRDRLASEPRDWIVTKTIQMIFENAESEECNLVGHTELQLLINGVKENPLYANDHNFSDIYEIEYKVAAHFGEKEKLYEIEYGLDLKDIHLMKTTMRAGYLAGKGYFELARKRLEEAIYLAQTGVLPASDQDISDAIEVLAVINAERR